jgi:hypothetical protein
MFRIKIEKIVRVHCPDEISATEISLGRQSSLRALRKTNIYHAGCARNYKNIVFFTLCVPCDLCG